jgi:hypothetical protein
MRKALRNILIFGLTSAAVAVCAGPDAMALGFGDISGKWCGNIGSYIFKPRTLTVIFYSDKSRRDYKVDSYQYTDGEVTITWRRDTEALSTKFGEFSADRRAMAQIQNDVGPRREFRRCS